MLVLTFDLFYSLSMTLKVAFLFFWLFFLKSIFQNITGLNGLSKSIAFAQMRKIEIF